MKYEIMSDIGDGKANAPPATVVVDDIEELMNYLVDELINDYGDPMGPGMQITVKRVQ